MEALQAGKHVLVEKPMTADTEQAQRLIDEAARRNLVLMVDHTFVYTGAVRKIRELINGGTLGDVYYYDSTRVNLGLFQHDVNVIWDLAVHDLSIMDYILPEVPVEVSATGIGHARARRGCGLRESLLQRVDYCPFQRELAFSGEDSAHIDRRHQKHDRL